MKITAESVKAAEKVLADNGIDEDEVQTVLQAVGYALADVELYPDGGKEPGRGAGFDFAEEFARGAAEAGGTFDRASPGSAWIGTPDRRLEIRWRSGAGCFAAFAGPRGRPSFAFACATGGWEAWQARDAGRDFAKRAYEAAARLDPK